MAWWPFGRRTERPPPPPRKVRIRSDVIDLLCQAARASHPHEFGGLLRSEKGVVTELMLLPGTISGETHAIFQLGMLPIDFTVKGTVHSHPNGIARPSEADRELFQRFGSVHLIIGAPYTPRNWRAYDGRGEPVEAEVVPS